MSLWGPLCSEPGALIFFMGAEDSADALPPGGGLIGRVNLNVLNTQDTVICIRLEDDPQRGGYRNQGYKPYGELLFPTLKHGNLLIGAGKAGGACPQTVFKLGDLNLDESISPMDLVLELSCVFLSPDSGIARFI